MTLTVLTMRPHSILTCIALHWAEQQYKKVKNNVTLLALRMCSYVVIHYMCRLVFKGFISTLLVSLMLPDPFLGVSLMN